MSDVAAEEVLDDWAAPLRRRVGQTVTRFCSTLEHGISEKQTYAVIAAVEDGRG